MTLDALAPALFSLAGVLVGAIGSLAGVLLSTRTSRDQLKATQRAALRAEKREAVLAYLRTMQECQQFVSHVVGGTVTGSEREDQSSTFEKEIWLAQKALALSASAQLRRASFALTERMDHVMFNDLPDGQALWPYLTPLQDVVIEAARNDLDTL